MSHPTKLETVRIAAIQTSMGPLFAAATGRGIFRLGFLSRKEGLRQIKALNTPENMISPTASPSLKKNLRRLAAHFKISGDLPPLPVHLAGNPFQRKVWKALMRIPSGETRSYAEVARQIGHPRASRAVGSACARNPVALLVPCHRVIRADGALGGYAWGLSRKKRLLRGERNAVPTPRS